MDPYALEAQEIADFERRALVCVADSSLSASQQRQAIELIRKEGCDRIEIEISRLRDEAKWPILGWKTIHNIAARKIQKAELEHRIDRILSRLKTD